MCLESSEGAGSVAGFPRTDEADLRVEEELKRAVRRLQSVTGLPVAFGGFAVEHGVVALTEVAGGVSEALRGLVIVRGRGLGGKVIARGRAEAVDDYLQAATISHEYDLPVHQEGLRAILAVPVVVRPSVRAVLYAALRQPQPLGDRVLAAASTVAWDLRFQLQVSDEVGRRLDALQLTSEAPSILRASGSALEELRAVHAELAAIAEKLDDPVLRCRIRAAGCRIARAFGGSDGSGPTRVEPPHLSAREIDVLAQVALGCTNAEAGQRLGLLPETVKSYLRSASRKLGSHTRMEAVVTARSAGLLP
jgi:DNA-binding CsgD family transcriptional regulator